MKIKEFIEKGIEGGYDIKRALVVNKDDEYNPISMQSSDKMFLDPKAWEAVGKVDFKKTMKQDGSIKIEDYCKEYAQWAMKNMIEHLCEGGTIESYLETL